MRQKPILLVTMPRTGTRFWMHTLADVAQCQVQWIVDPGTNLLRHKQLYVAHIATHTKIMERIKYESSSGKYIQLVTDRAIPDHLASYTKRGIGREAFLNVRRAYEDYIAEYPPDMTLRYDIPNRDDQLTMLSMLLGRRITTDWTPIS